MHSCVLFVAYTTISILLQVRGVPRRVPAGPGGGVAAVQPLLPPRLHCAVAAAPKSVLTLHMAMQKAVNASQSEEEFRVMGMPPEPVQPHLVLLHELDPCNRVCCRSALSAARKSSPLEAKLPAYSKQGRLALLRHWKPR